MNTEYRYILEPYNGIKTRYRCPHCNKKGVFTRYIDQQAEEHLKDAVGKCNRLVKCGYHYTPKQYFNDNNIPFDSKIKYKANTSIKPKPEPKISFINVEVFDKSMNIRQPNYFIDYLASIWDCEVAIYLAYKYNIGASKLWQGATVFWQMDIKGNIRSGKIMLYNASNGKRVKQPYNHVNWVHKALKLDSFNLEQCYFGEHLLNEDISKPVAIVESEKTAIISSIYLPEFIWLACGGVKNLNEAKTKVLKGRNVVLFPDLGCFDLWNDKIPSLTSSATFRTSTILEIKASESEKSDGLDIADYLVKIKL